MATTFTIKRKAFAESGEKKSNAGKILGGVAATAATAGLAFAGARRGVFGGNIAMKANNAYINAGKKLMTSKSATLSGAGLGMVQSGAEKWAAGSAQLKNSVAQKAGKTVMQGDALANYTKNKTAQKMQQVAGTVDLQKVGESGIARAFA